MPPSHRLLPLILAGLPLCVEAATGRSLSADKRQATKSRGGHALRSGGHTKLDRSARLLTLRLRGFFSRGSSNPCIDRGTLRCWAVVASCAFRLVCTHEPRQHARPKTKHAAWKACLSRQRSLLRRFGCRVCKSIAYISYAPGSIRHYPRLKQPSQTCTASCHSGQPRSTFARLELA
jgi:hypothetical protein